MSVTELCHFPIRSIRTGGMIGVCRPGLLLLPEVLTDHTLGFKLSFSLRLSIQITDKPCFDNRPNRQALVFGRRLCETHISSIQARIVPEDSKA